MVLSHAHHVHVVGFRALRAMNRHKPNRISWWRRFFAAQVELLQEVIERSILTDGLRYRDAEFLPRRAIIREVAMRVFLWDGRAELLLEVSDKAGMRIGSLA